MFIEKIKARESKIMVYGITPPRANTEEHKLQEVAVLQMERILSIEPDALILYDIQDETSRTSVERPFPFMETIDPFLYSNTLLSALDIPRILYRSAGKYTVDGFSQYLSQARHDRDCTVLVGAPSRNEKRALSLDDAYSLCARLAPDMCLGGVAIPERHRSKGDEHLRLEHKHAQGCSFFVSQCVYDAQTALDFLSDYHYHCQSLEKKPDPVILTFTPCGSEKTLQFMEWLGISIPRWLKNELVHSADILERSLDLCVESWQQLQNFAAEKEIPIGANIESVAVRKVEVEASLELFRRIRAC